MIRVNLEVHADNLEAVLELLNSTEGISSISVEDPDDQKLKPMTATDFYKKINASNLAQKENKIFSQTEIEKEVQTW